MRRTLNTLLAAAIAFGPTIAQIPAAEDDDTVTSQTVSSPADTVRISGGLGGAFFVDRGLAKRYNDLKTRVRSIKREILAGRPSSEAALRELEEIETQSKLLREMIEATKTFVTAFKAFKKSESVLIPLAESQSIILRSDNVTMRGWEGPGIKVVMEKVILANEKPDPSEFDAIRVEHEVKLDEELVGKTPTQRAADEQAFRDSPAGKKMSEEQLEERERFVRKLFRRDDRFHAFQGIASNVLSINGLRHDQGNEQLSYQIKSPSGGGTFSSDWKRHASVTVYVPPCKRILVAGCMVKVDIADIDANLMLTTNESRDRDYEGTFEVRTIRGDVVIDQAPVRVLQDISGSVSCTMTDTFVNSGTRHRHGFRTTDVDDPAKTVFSNVSGALEGRFLRTDLLLGGLHGPIDIHNEYGSTSIVASDAQLAEHAMRIISHSGTIAVTGKRTLLESIPIYAYTQCGTLHTNLPQESLEDMNISTGTPVRNWKGFVTPSKERFSMVRFERPAQAIDGEDRPPGLDLISHAGRVNILADD